MNIRPTTRLVALSAIVGCCMMALDVQVAWSQPSQSEGTAQATSPERPDTGAKIRVAIVPLCLSAIPKSHNAQTQDYAAQITKVLADDPSYRVIPYADVAASLKRSGLSIADLTGSKFSDLQRALPPHDVVLFVGPHPGQGGWFPVRVAVDSDFEGDAVGGSVSQVSLGSDDTLPPFNSAEAARLTKVIRAKVPAPAPPAVSAPATHGGPVPGLPESESAGTVENIPEIESSLVKRIRTQGPGSRFVIPGFDPRLPNGPFTLKDGTLWRTPGGETTLNNSEEFPGDDVVTLSYSERKPSIHRFQGTVKLGRHVFVGEGEARERLTFAYIPPYGYIYLRGKGRVILDGGKEVKLGY
jgi:hypothetical protein